MKKNMKSGVPADYGGLYTGDEPGRFSGRARCKTRPCKVKKVDAYTFRIILTQGLNRQIRRMCAYFDFRVVTLKRIRIMNILLGDLPEGQWREVTGRELKELKGGMSHE